VPSRCGSWTGSALAVLSFLAGSDSESVALSDCQAVPFCFRLDFGGEGVAGGVDFNEGHFHGFGSLGFRSLGCCDILIRF